MITYVPFLKFKSGEATGIGGLTADVRAAICPFFDFPRKDKLTADEFKVTSAKICRSIAKHMHDLSEFYFDVHDLTDPLPINGTNEYRYLLEQLSESPVIPVVGLDRAPTHNRAVRDLKNAGAITSKHVALRLGREDFESFAAVEDELDDLASTFELFESVDLILDCRVCEGFDLTKVAKDIIKFSKKFCGQYPVRRVVVTGSSLPGSLSNLVKVKTDVILNRNELKIFESVATDHSHATLVFGDYTTVSPDYADKTIPPEILQTMMTPRFIYTMKGRHFIIRGGRIRGAYAQYFAMAKTLCGKGFFRGKIFSWGDAYLEEKSHGLGSNCTPSSVIRPTVNAHITYMVSVLPF